MMYMLSVTLGLHTEHIGCPVSTTAEYLERRHLLFQAGIKQEEVLSWLLGSRPYSLLDSSLLFRSSSSLLLLMFSFTCSSRASVKLFSKLAIFVFL